MSGGTVDHIVISNPGTGYQAGDAITVQLVGQLPAGGTAATAGTPVLISNVSTGSLTKLGDGTLTLTSTFNYTGPTVINAGTLDIANGAANTLTTVSGLGSLTVRDSMRRLPL